MLTQEQHKKKKLYKKVLKLFYYHGDMWQACLAMVLLSAHTTIFSDVSFYIFVSAFDEHKKAYVDISCIEIKIVDSGPMQWHAKKEMM